MGKVLVICVFVLTFLCYEANTGVTPAPQADRRARCTGRKGRLPLESHPTPISFTPSNDSTKYDYHELLHKSLLFYDAQRSGYKTNTSRVPWRGDANLHDGCDVGRDLTGGWHDAGDHVKFGFPMASATTVLAWGMLLFKDAYVEAGEWQNALDNLKWSTDYFIKAHTGPNELYGQVGDGQSDHYQWGRPEESTILRPSFKITASKPGSDLAGETAAAMAASSIVFEGEGMTSYSAELLQHAKELYNFSNIYRGFYHNSIPDAKEFYKSYDYIDEIVWACLWLYKATKSPVRLSECTSKYNGFHMYYVASEFSWSSKTAGIQLLMAESTKLQKYRDIADKFVVFVRDRVPKTPGGLAFFGEWGSNRYAANAAFISVATAATTGSRHAGKWVKFAQQQIYCLLGDGDNKRSYVVGFGKNPPTHVQHKASSCPTWSPGRYRSCSWANFGSSKPNPHILYGALVGGPDKNGSFRDNRSNYVNNAVSCDYNAGFQSAIAGLKHFVMQNRRARCTGRKGRLPLESRPTPISFTPSNDSTKYDYHELLHKSLLFYDAQRSGYKTNTSRVPWRGDANLHDGCDVGRDLTGGWHDAGDHVKFGFPMASATTVLAWGMLLFKDAYVEAGEWQNALDNLKWSTDYFIKAHTGPNELYGQVGDGQSDHYQWGRPEESTILRPSFKITASKPGSDLAGETAAAMAASSIVFKGEGMTSYSAELLQHAKELYNFSNLYRGFYHNSIPDAKEFYKSYDYIDEIVWACLWLYKATKSPVRLSECTSKYNGFHTYYVASEFSWSSKTAGIQLLMAESTKLQKYRDIADKFVVFVRDRVPKTPGGLAFFGEWGSNRYAANAAFISVATAATTGSRHAGKWVKFAQQQIYCLLGDGDNKRSYVVGFGKNPPTHVHHKASSCPTWSPGRYRSCSWANFGSSKPNPHVLYGALVGGPDKNGSFRDIRSNYVNNEVSCDYNAGFQSAIAGLKHFVMQNRSG